MKTERMPAVFIGHGSPMNAIETNQYSVNWEQLGLTLPRPKAIVAISAHWFTEGQKVRTAGDNRQINDMYGFPEELYQVHYEPAGDPALAEEIMKLTGAEADNSWGIDHGVWSVLCRMYPAADIPVVMMSTDIKAKPETLYETGKALSRLRDEGVLILASGNVVHNLSLCDYSMEGRGYSWAVRFDSEVAMDVINDDKDAVLSYRKLENSSKAFRTDEHFRPLIYALGAADKEDKVRTENMECTLGALSMTSFIFS